MFSYSRGRDIHDAQPVARSAQTFDLFVAALGSDRAADKATAPYFCGPLNGDGRRCREGVLPRRWLALDFDKIEANALPSLRGWLERFDAAAWPTHSSRPDAPRLRALVALNRDADRDEAIKVGDVIAADVADEFGAAVALDVATHRGEQPVFVPPVGVTLERLRGDPVAVDAYLAARTKPKPDRPQNDDGDFITEGRNVHLTRLAGRLRRAALAQDELEAALLAVNTKRCRPPLEEREVLTIARSVARYPAGEEPETKPLALKPLAAFLADSGPIEYAVDDLLVRGWLYALTGPTGSGKTAVATLLALCAAAGRSFGTHATTAVPVVYVAGENPADVRLRFLVAADALGIDPARSKVHILDQGVLLADRGAELAALVESVGAGLVIVDTDAAVSLSAGAEENDNAGRMEHARQLRALTRVSSRPVVVDLCHPKARAARDELVPRGGSSLLGEIDGNLCLWRDGDLAELFTHAEKFRGAPASVRFRKELKTHPLAVDTKGRSIQIPHYLPLNDHEAQQQQRQAWTDGNLVLWAMLQEPDASQEAWARTCGFISPTGTARKDKVNRLLKSLAADRLVKQSRGGKWLLTDAGKKEAARP